MTSRPIPSGAGSASTLPGLRCLGCADSILRLPHQCAGPRELVPYGGWCGCRLPDCGPRRNREGTESAT